MSVEIQILVAAITMVSALLGIFAYFQTQGRHRREEWRRELATEVKTLKESVKVEISAVENKLDGRIAPVEAKLDGRIANVETRMDQ